MNENTLKSVTTKLEELLKGKTITRILQSRESEVCIELNDGSRLFIDSISETPLEFSVTEGSEDK